jgi:hypothetical protein
MFCLKCHVANRAASWEKEIRSQTKGLSELINQTFSAGIPSEVVNVTLSKLFIKSCLVNIGKF